jgi:small redox-active disulfide protein 2
MKVRILGSGCDKCKKLAANAEAAAAKLGLECEIEKVTDINEITAYGVMMTPALAIDGKVVSVGKVLSPDEAAELMKPGAVCAAPPEEPACCCCGGAETEKAKETSCCRGGGSAKKWLTAVLLLFVVASVAFVVVREVKSRSGDSTAAAAAVPAKSDALTVYYFHGTQRCMTCNRIEELAKAAIEGRYGKELADGKVVFRSVNVEEPANEHFIKDFQLASRTVVMARDGKYETFDAVWTLVGEPEKFAAYLQDGAAKMLAKK